MSSMAKDAPDRFCLTLPNGECVSTDPRCMHQPKDYATPTRINELERKVLLRQKIEKKSIRPEPGTSNLMRNAQGGSEVIRVDGSIRKRRYHDLTRMTMFAFLENAL